MDECGVNLKVGEMFAHHAESDTKVALKAWSHCVHIQFFVYIASREAIIHRQVVNHYPPRESFAVTHWMLFLNQA
jgi:hypothetical protein